MAWAADPRADAGSPCLAMRCMVGRAPDGSAGEVWPKVLRRLEVEHMAILERVDLELDSGLCVLTGETGAGKSLLIDALQLALGARGDPGMVRAGERALRVSALFEVADDGVLADRLRSLGAAPEEGTLLLVREVAREGRGTCRVNGQLVPTSTLRELGTHLLTLAGQGEHHRFAQAAAQQDYLDAFAGPAAQEGRGQVASIYAQWRQAVQARAAIGGDARERARHRDMLAFAVAEIDALRLAADEEETLSARRQLLASAERLMAATESGLTVLWEGEAAVRDRLGALDRELEAAARIEPHLEEPLGLLRQAAIAVDEAGRALRRYRDGLQLDPGEASALEERWTQIQRCKRKYGDTLEAVLRYRDGAAAECAELEAADERALQLDEQIARYAKELGQASVELHGVRVAAAQRLQVDVGRELSELGMPTARLRVEVALREDPAGVPGGAFRLVPGERGADTVSFLWAANPGEPPQPLGKVASGGELARLLLALHALRAEGIDVPTIIFDEVDAGIGGRAAAAVAARLQLLGAARQVLCVTHLGIVAAAADHHLSIEKRAAGERTGTVVRPLDGEDRALEIARMLDGGRGEASREHAREMLRRQARSAG